MSTKGRCRKCRADVVWIPNPRGGWLPPLGRFDERLNDEQHTLLHSGAVQHLVDGELVPIRASAVLVWHECDPDLVPEAVQTLTERQVDALVEARAARLLQDRLEAQAYLEARRAGAGDAPQQREAELAQVPSPREWESAESEQEPAAKVPPSSRRSVQGFRSQWLHAERERAHEKHGEIASVTCPFCGATPGVLCFPKGTHRTAHGGHFITNPHPERRDWAYGSGMVAGESPHTPRRDSVIRDWVDGHRKASQVQLREWLLANRDMWSEFGTAGDDVNLFGNPDDSPHEAGTEELTPL